MKLMLLILLIILPEPLRGAESSRYFFSELTRSSRDFKVISRSYKSVAKRYYSTHSSLVNRGGYVRLPMKNKNLKVFEDIIPDLPKILSRIPLFEKADMKDLFVKRFGGLTNLNYGIIYKGEKYVLRIPNASLSLVDRKSEKEILEEVAAHHFTQKDLYFDVNTGIQLRPYIEGEELYADRINPQAIVQVADLFCELHASPLRLPYVSNFDLIEEYREELRKRGVVLNETYSTIFSKINKLRMVLPKLPSKLVPTHGDPHPVNFIKSSQRLYLLDWEYARLGDPIWDLSYFSTYGDLTDEQDESLLCHYLKIDKATDQEKARLRIYKPVIELTNTLRFKLFQVAATNYFPLEELRDWEEISLQNAINAVSYQGFAEALDFLVKETKQ